MGFVVILIIYLLLSILIGLDDAMAGREAGVIDWIFLPSVFVIKFFKKV